MPEILIRPSQISANGTSNGQILASNGTVAYWTSGGTGYNGSTGFTGSAGTTGFTGSAGTGISAGANNQVIYKDSTGTLTGNNNLTFTGASLTVNGTIVSSASAGDEGGEIQLARSVTNNSLAGSIVIDSYQNKIRIFENGGTIRGAFIDLTAAAAGVGTNLLAGGSGYSGSTGFTGSAGSTGFTGSVGTTGFTGSQGNVGFTGSTGFTGSLGNTGFTGSLGSVGFTGSVGFVGSLGFVGSFGFTGSLGFTGSSGFVGSAGVGFAGSQGLIGYTGSAGTGGGGGGFTGSTGFTGSAGAAASGLSGDPYLNYVSLLLHFNGANAATRSYDSSYKGLNITFTGSAQLSNTQARFGNTSLVTSNGTAGRAYTEVVTAGSPLDLSTGNTDFTIETWAYPRAYPASALNEFSAIMVAWGTVGFGAGYSSVSLAITSAGNWSGQWNVDNTGGGDRSISGGSATLNTWTHVALTRQGDVFRIFVNGTLVTSNTSSTIVPRFSSDRWVFGSGTNGTYKFDGFLDDIRITKGVARYTSNFTIPSAEFPEFNSVQGFTGSVGAGFTGSVGYAGSAGTGGASVSISDNAPSSPSAGNVWWNSSTGIAYIYYNDGDSSQWVELSPKSVGYTGSQGDVTTDDVIALNLTLGLL